MCCSVNKIITDHPQLSLIDEKVALTCLRKYIDEHGATLFLGGRSPILLPSAILLTISELVTFGFLSRGDPFVQQVLRLFRSWSLKLLKEKAKVSVEKGCFLIGIVDETATLKGHRDAMYDQDDRDIDTMDLPEIFVRIPNISMSGILPNRCQLQITDSRDPSKRKVVEEVCLIGRAPTLHPGDLRLVRAVDKPELHYLCDVVVFPASGDQDIPSQCSGGDLDGDDYTIIWDRSLFPKEGHRYERCMSYLGPKPIITNMITMKHIFDFMVDFMKNDSLGTIAHAHLAWAHAEIATMGGLQKKGCRAFSDECMQLAELHSTAVDFAKTGVAARMPEELRPERFPDFMEYVDKPSFVSNTPLSLMYRQVKSSSVDAKSNGKKYDNTLCNVAGMLDWLDLARTIKAEYDQDIQRLMNQYGIRTEPEVVTGFILDYNQQFSGKNEYKMRLDVGTQYNSIKEMYRERITKIAEHDATTGEPLNQGLAEVRMDAIVAAMYDVTFSESVVNGTDTTDARVAKLSFPWIFHEVLGRMSNQRNQRLQ